MKKLKVMSIFGTRPEAIKMAPLVNKIKENDRLENIVCITGQHREMLMQVLEIFNIIPDINLDIMKAGQTVSSITTAVINGLDNVFKENKPDIVLVHGDTTTSFAAALAAFYHQIPVGHVEAGLRTYDKYSPFPEEMNRVLTGDIADLHFSPTQANKDNLIKENINKGIYITGNTVIDAMETTVQKDYVFKNKDLQKIDFNDGKKVIAMTAHRRENLGKPLENICNAIKALIEKHDDIRVIYPVHLNPAVRNTVFDILGNTDRVHLIDPIDVCDMHNLMDRSYMVMTDSGGLQEEAPSLGKPVIVLRTETERPEAVAAGTAVVIGVEKDDIIAKADTLLNDKESYDKMAKAINPYGDGKASLRIIDAIIEYFK